MIDRFGLAGWNPSALLWIWPVRQTSHSGGERVPLLNTHTHTHTEPNYIGSPRKWKFLKLLQAVNFQWNLSVYCASSLQQSWQIIWLLTACEKRYIVRNTETVPDNFAINVQLDHFLPSLWQCKKYPFCNRQHVHFNTPLMLLCFKILKAKHFYG